MKGSRGVTKRSGRRGSMLFDVVVFVIGLAMGVGGGYFYAESVQMRFSGGSGD
jgi:hypothetical protein